MAKIFGIFLSLLCSVAYSQNIVKIAQESGVMYLATVDSIVVTGTGNLGYLKSLNGKEHKILKYKTQRDSYGYLMAEYAIAKNDTIVVFADNKNDTLVNKIAISKDAAVVYNAIKQLDKVKAEANAKKRIALLITWFMDAARNKGFKPWLTRIIVRRSSERDYFFDLVNVAEADVKFSAKQKKLLEQEFSADRCLKSENFYIVYLLRYSYDKELEGILKELLSHYCLPFGDSHIYIMETILHNNKSAELAEIYTRFRKIYADTNEGKKVYNEFLDKL